MGILLQVLKHYHSWNLWTGRKEGPDVIVGLSHDNTWAGGPYAGLFTVTYPDANSARDSSKHCYHRGPNDGYVGPYKLICGPFKMGNGSSQFGVYSDMDISEIISTYSNSGSTTIHFVYSGNDYLFGGCHLASTFDSPRVGVSAGLYETWTGNAKGGTTDGSSELRT